MKHLFFIFLFVVLISMGFVNGALSLDKGKLKFNIEKGENVCKMVKVSSEDYIGNIVIRDIWPEAGEEDSGFSKYTLSSEDYGISIDYPSKISYFSGESEVEVCLSGEDVGNFRGALIFTPEAGDEQINVVVEIGTWLFVNVSKSEDEVIEESVTEPVSSWGGSDSGRGSPPLNLNPVVVDEIQDIASDNNVKETEEELEIEDSAGITGAVIGGGNRSWKVIGIVITIVLIAVAVIYNYNKTKRRSL